jgi:hypothetical protein
MLFDSYLLCIAPDSALHVPGTQEGRSAFHSPVDVQVNSNWRLNTLGMKPSTHLKEAVWLKLLPSLDVNSVLGRGMSVGHVITAEQKGWIEKNRTTDQLVFHLTCAFSAITTKPDVAGAAEGPNHIVAAGKLVTRTNLFHALINVWWRRKVLACMDFSRSRS